MANEMNAADQAKKKKKKKGDTKHLFSDSHQHLTVKSKKMKFVLLLLTMLLAVSNAVRMPAVTTVSGMEKRRYNSLNKIDVLAVALPGDPLVTGTLAQGLMNCFSLYSNIIFARIALSWFPQLPQQFPILKPIFTVTEPYLRAFRNTIPPIGGFDISAIPAIFILDIMGQTVAAVGADFPEHLRHLEVKSSTSNKKTKNSSSKKAIGQTKLALLERK